MLSILKLVAPYAYLQDHMNYINSYLDQVSRIVELIDRNSIQRLVEELLALKTRNGRLFIIGVGGSAANCSHAVNDFRKICDIEAYAPVDNVAEVTARTNDEGWETVFKAYLKTSRANAKDAVLVFSVGGGDAKRGISANIVHALDDAISRDMRILGIVGRDGGYTAQVGDEVLVIPTVDPDHITPHTEAFQAVIWHCLVCHPTLIQKINKWESQES